MVRTSPRSTALLLVIVLAVAACTQPAGSAAPSPSAAAVPSPGATASDVVAPSASDGGTDDYGSGNDDYSSP